jgi:hypothetical protein
MEWAVAGGRLSIFGRGGAVPTWKPQRVVPTCEWSKKFDALPIRSDYIIISTERNGYPKIGTPHIESHNVGCANFVFFLICMLGLHPCEYSGQASCRVICLAALKK